MAVALVFFLGWGIESSGSTSENWTGLKKDQLVKLTASRGEVDMTHAKSLRNVRQILAPSFYSAS